MSKDLLDVARGLAGKSCQDLKTPDDDIMPVMLWQGPYGGGMMPMIPMSNEDDKDRLAEMIVTVLAVSRADSAVTITTSWTVEALGTPDSDPLETLGCMPSEHPDRTERITIVCVQRNAGDSISSARLTRHPDRGPDLAQWDTVLQHLEVDGRFGSAMHLGLELAEKMPPDLVEIIDEGWREGQGQDMIRRFHRVFAALLSEA